VTLALRTRLTIVYTAVFGLLLTLVGLVSYRVLAGQLDADATANLMELTNGLHGYLRLDETPAFVYDRNDSEQSAFVQEATRYFQIYDAATGQLISQSDAMEPLGLRFTADEVRGFHDRPQPQDFRTDAGRIRISNSVISGNAGRTYLLQVGASLDALDGVLDRFLELLLWTVPVGLAVAILAGRALAALALQPLSQFADATRAIDIRNLAARLPIRGAGDEIDAVAEAFNDSLGRLELAVGEMRQFSTALAHELRTPLTALRGEIELAMLQTAAADAHRQTLASQLEEIDKLRRLIDQLLTLARAEAGEIAIARERVDVSAMAASLVDQLELVAQAKGIRLHCEGAAGIVVTGDPQWLERLWLNLIDNAIKFTPSGGSVVVRVSRDGDAAAIAVCDTGTGILPDAAPHLFERFYRADPARSPAVHGAGLGLTLVKWIVERHSGRILVDSHPGKGSTFTVRLPIADLAPLS
jgi:heavy metal sensor kinase